MNKLLQCENVSAAQRRNCDSVKSSGGGETVSRVDVLPSCGERQNIFSVTFLNSQLCFQRQNQVYLGKTRKEKKVCFKTNLRCSVFKIKRIGCAKY